MAKKADPNIENAYRTGSNMFGLKVWHVNLKLLATVRSSRKDAFAIAKDDEIREVLKCMVPRSKKYHGP